MINGELRATIFSILSVSDRFADILLYFRIINTFSHINTYNLYHICIYQKLNQQIINKDIIVFLIIIFNLIFHEYSFLFTEQMFWGRK